MEEEVLLRAASPLVSRRSLQADPCPLRGQLMEQFRSSARPGHNIWMHAAAIVAVVTNCFGRKIANKHISV